MPYEMSDAERNVQSTARDKSTLVSLAIREEKRRAAHDPPYSQFRDAGDFLASVRDQMIHRRNDPRLDMTNAAGTWAGEQVAADGGFALPDAFVDDVLAPAFGDGSLPAAFGPVPTASAALRVAVDPAGDWTVDVPASIVTEGGQATPGKAPLNLVSCPLAKIPALVHCSDELAGRSPGYLRWVARKLASKIRNAVESKLVAGSGMNEPLGILNAPATITVTKDTSQAAATLTASNLGKMAARVVNYPRAIWVAHPSILPQLAGLGVGVWNPSGRGPFGDILGRPLYLSQWANPLGTSGDVICVNPDAYLVAADGPYNAATASFAFDQSLDSFRATVWLGAAPLLSTPITARTGTDTVGPCSVVEAR